MDLFTFNEEEFLVIIAVVGVTYVIINSIDIKVNFAEYYY